MVLVFVLYKKTYKKSILSSFNSVAHDDQGGGGGGGQQLSIRVSLDVDLCSAEPALLAKLAVTRVPSE